ncbi:LOW QUALITY PROTEIN: proteasomal ATPase-associated factor 1-like [Amphiura filiformis]|uniref:LOW QUALITY PROTEIN: proteasomal ATPase-associated factor 1-like n=1 Tax=Amphiura filiformis TaxID=82378 RepID=UPI003B21F554
MGLPRRAWHSRRAQILWFRFQWCTSGEPGIQGELKSHGPDSNGVPQVSASEGFTVSEVTKRSLVLSFPDKNVSTKFTAPSTSLADIHKRSICSLDVSSGGALGVSASDDGTLKIWQTSDGLVRRDLQGHIGEVSTCQFFPSGIVVLSGGLDTQLKIWSAEDGSCPVTMRGHGSAIRSTDVVDKGRNIVSCSSDGSARLWDCGQSKCLATVYKGDCPVNDCAVGVASNCVDLGTPADSQSRDREVGTQDKLLLLATEGGELAGVGLHSRTKIFQVSSSSAFNCCTCVSPDTVIGGTEDGKIYVIDIRNTSEPKQIIQRSSPVLCVRASKEGFIAGTGGQGTFHYQSVSISSTIVHDLTIGFQVSTQQRDKLIVVLLIREEGLLVMVRTFIDSVS